MHTHSFNAEFVDKTELWTVQLILMIAWGKYSNNTEQSPAGIPRLDSFHGTISSADHFCLGGKEKNESIFLKCMKCCCCSFMGLDVHFV